MPAPEKLQALIEEAQRQLAICNACRYCEGYCAVFPALQRRLAFDERDVHYLANLCHNCGACLYACQYAPPHAFAVNFPLVLAQVRKETYKRHAWPAALAGAFERNGTVVALLTMACLALALVLIAWYASPTAFFAAHADTQGAFYAVLPHGVMTTVFGGVFASVVLAIFVSSVRFWRHINGGKAAAGAHALAEASSDAATLRYLDGAGELCNVSEHRHATTRRVLHHFAFYGFLLCFASTVVATHYHYALGRPAPYAFASVPVLLGTVGGVLLAIGSAGLWRLRRDADLEDRTQRGMNAGFIALLFATSASGLVLLALRETRAMGVLLALHLGAVMALFVTLPYGKFVHATYRLAALVRFHVERRGPPPQFSGE